MFVARWAHLCVAWWACLVSWWAYLSVAQWSNFVTIERYDFVTHFGRDLSFDYSFNFDCCFMLLFLVMVHCWKSVVLSDLVGE